MKQLFLISLLAFAMHSVFGQTIVRDNETWYDSLHRELKVVKEDTSKIKIWTELANYHKFSRADSGIYYATKALTLSRKISFDYGELDALHMLNLSHATLGNNSKSLRIVLEGLRIIDGLVTPLEKRIIWQKGAYQLSFGAYYYRLGDYKTSLFYYMKSHNIFKSISSHPFISISESNIGRTYLKLDKLDSAYYFGHKALRLGDSINVNWVREVNNRVLGGIHRDLENLDSSLYYYQKAINTGAVQGSWRSEEFLEIAKLLNNLNKTDSSIYFAEESLRMAIENKLYLDIIDASLYLSDFFHDSEPSRSLDYSNNALAYKDSLSNLGNMTAFGDFLDFDEQQRQHEVEAAREESQARIRMNAFLGSIFTLLVIAFFLYRNNRTKQRAKQKIEKAYDQLKSTQTQLIHSEKMASLGELTAGIAHEIQNPLNFVNNFSEVSGELVEELKDERTKLKAEREEGLEEEILDDLKQNLQKINHHGQRASGIVKGMLEHSRTGSGEKELTDINKLADEYLRLSYHGLRAKDKSFNADFKTDFDESLPKVKVITQDLGRVILNLINNAFYAVSSKQEAESKEGYKPTVTVSTATIKSPSGDLGVIISVKDNGAGIPDDIKDKIFQPFFTTKPTGSGTGLGLSMSYDIITKGHGGELKVVTEEGRGSEFIITLPNTNQQ